MNRRTLLVALISLLPAAALAQSGLSSQSGSAAGAPTRPADARRLTTVRSSILTRSLKDIMMSACVPLLLWMTM